MNDDKIRISPDALIAMIVTEAQDRELARMPSLEEMNEDFQPSEKFQRKMEALVRDTKRKAERKKRLLNVKRFFITLTAAISIFSCTMLPVKAVREAVITTLIEWHDKFVSIIYVNEESPVSTFHITPSYIPSGFSQIESSGESTGRYYGQFQNSEGDWFSLRVLPVENSQVTSLDSEFSSYYSISFDNNQAIWGIMDDDSNTLLWESSTLSFQVRGNLSITELIKISEGIQDIQNGDREQALALLEKFSPLLKKYAFFLQSEDALQDFQCFLLAFAKNLQLNELTISTDGAIISYINKAIYHHYIALSKAKRHQLPTVSIESQTDYDPLQFDTAFSESDTYNNLLLLDLKRALSTEEYHVIYDHYFRQYSIQEIATRDNKSRQAINKCKKTAIIKLRRYFGVTS